MRATLSLLIAWVSINGLKLQGIEFDFVLAAIIITAIVIYFIITYLGKLDKKEIIEKAVKNQDKKLFCPKCHNDEFAIGPSGGCSTNVKCTQCNTEYDHTPMGLTPLN